MPSKKSEILDALVSQLTTELTDFKLITFDRVRLAVDDFQDFELPALQLWDAGAVHTPNRGRTTVDWSIVAEIVVRSTTAGLVDQRSLFDLMYDVKAALGGNVALRNGFNISGFQHILFDRETTDLHTQEPFYIAQLFFRAKFEEDYTGSC